MKRFLLISIIMAMLCLPSQAFPGKKQEKIRYNDIKNVIEKQLVYSNTYNLDGLSALYSPAFVNTDGLNKDFSFKLVKDTWQNYPTIAYTAEIKNINADDKYAKAEVYETAFAMIDETDGFGPADLYSKANVIYYLEKIGQDWLITAERVLDEKSIIRYGEARFIKMDLLAPSLISAGDYYTAALKVDVPENVVVVASIGNTKAAYPQTKPEDVFRKLPDDNVLERMFAANTNNVNEYAVASVGIAKSEIKDKKNVKIVMGGVAFIITRINVVPENKFVTEEESGKVK